MSIKIGKPVGQCGQSNNQVHGSQADSDPVSGDQVSSREFNDPAKSRLLIPPPPMLTVDPSSETDDEEDIIANDNTNAGNNSSTLEASNATKFIRNGNELRRSLRRINSLTRRKLSPSSIKDAITGLPITVQAKSPTPTVKSPKNRKHSHGSIDTGTGSAAVTTVELQEPEFNTCSARLV